MTSDADSQWVYVFVITKESLNVALNGTLVPFNHLQWYIKGKSKDIKLVSTQIAY